MIFRIIILLILTFNVTFSFQQTFAEKYLYYASQDSLLKYLKVLTADSLTGRFTGTPGQQKAAAYIKNHFQNNNIEPLFKSGYYQPFVIAKLKPSGQLFVNNDTLEYFNDYISFDQDVTTSFSNKEILYVSNDIKAPKKIDAAGKFILLTQKEVEDFDNATLRKFFNHYKKEAAAGIIFSTPTFSTIKDEMKKELTRQRYALMDNLSRELEFPLFFVKENFIQSLKFQNKRWEKKFNKNKKVKVPLTLGIISGVINPNIKTIYTENTGGLIKGKNHRSGDSDHLVIMGHFDHLGIKEGDIYRGADDNASGIASIMELVRLFGLANKEGFEFERSIVFLAVSAEEIGLLGSEFYTLNPALPLEQTNAVLNIDMVGRENIDTLDKFSLYLIGADKINRELHEVNEEMNNKYVHLYLDYKYNEEDHPMRLYRRSDHYNFVKYGVPSVFYFGGFHEDYHKQSDTVDKINLEKLETVSKLFFLTAWEIATNPNLLNR